MSAPKHPNFASAEARIDSFKDFPTSCPVDHQDLATAGFYYYGEFEGYLDAVKCFHCDAGFCKWEAGDDPWDEHARGSPECEFLKQNRKCLNIKGGNIEDRNSEIDDWCSGMMVQEVLQTFSRTVVRNVLYERLLRYGKPYAHKDLLIRSVVKAMDRLQSTSEKEKMEPAPLKIPQKAMPKDEMICKVCFSGPVRVVFIPCGHVLCCEHCAYMLSSCCYCRQRITKRQFVYFC